MFEVRVVTLDMRNKNASYRQV